MNAITFPGLNLEFNIDPIAINIGDISIYWYGIIVTIAFIIGILLLKKKDGLFNMKFDDIMTLLIFLIPISILSARMYYVVFNLDFYLSNPIEIINIRSGGLAIYGGIIGAAITGALFCKIKKISLLDLSDFLVPSLAIGQAIGRLGNFINIEAYGEKTSLPWRMGMYEGNNYIEVHPTFLYEMIITFAIFIFLSLKKDKRKFKGEFTYLYLIIYSFFRILIENLRTDSLMLGTFKISALLSVIVFLVFLLLYLYNILTFIKAKNRNNNDNVKK